jgi:hypothetical protein
LEVRLKEPAYVYLLWVDSHGTVDPLYPWERDFNNRPQVQVPVKELHRPPKLNMGLTAIRLNSI